MEYKFCTSIVRFISKNFILSNAIIHGIIFLIPFSEYSLLQYKNMINLCILAWYPEILLNLLMSSNSFQWSLMIYYIQDHVTHR